MAKRITVVERPYILTFRASSHSYLLTSTEAQRLLDEYPAVRASARRIVLPGHNTNDPAQYSELRPATLGGGAAFIIED
jgi:hypothetical protein